MKTHLLRLAAPVALCVALGACAGLPRGHGPLDAFIFPAALNSGLPRDVTGAIEERIEPKEIRVVVPAGTDMHALVARIALSKEAVITVVSSGSKVVQQNGVTPNDFSVPVVYSIAVTGDRNPWTYRVLVREEERNARLGGILAPPGSTLQPDFSPTVHSYILQVPYATRSVRIEARAQTSTAKSVTIDGAENPGPAGAGLVAFDTIQERPVSIAILAEDGVTQEQYTLTIHRAPPDSNALLSLLDITGTPISPAFSPAQLTYQAVVPFETTRVVVKARTQSPVATLTLGVAPIVGGSAPAPAAFQPAGDPSVTAGARIDFAAGDGVALLVTVTAEDQSVQRYQVIVLRAPPDHNTFLAALSLSMNGVDVPLTPPFGGTAPVYTAVLPFSARRVTVKAAPQSRVASAAIEPVAAPTRVTFAVTGDVQGRNGATLDFPAPVIRLTFAVAVTAQDGSIQRYVVDMRRAPPDHNADLAGFSTSAGTLSPPFSARTAAYTVALGAAVAGTTLTAAASSPAALVSIAEQPGVKPAKSQSLAIAVAQGASQVVTFVVAAEDGTQRPIAVTVSREKAPLDSNALLQSLTVTGAPLAPAFDPAVVLYDVKLAASVESVSVAVRAQSPVAMVTIDGQTAGAAPRVVPMQAGSTRTVFIDVAAQNGAANRYTLRLAREQAAGGGAVTPPPPADAGSDHVLVSARNLRLPQKEAAALAGAGDTVGTSARITVRSYRTSSVITQYTVPVDVKQQGGIPTVSIAARSNGVSLDRNRLVEVETAVATTKGHFLSYTEAQEADAEVSVEIPFLLYGDNPLVHWPAIGTPVQVGGYLSTLPRARDRAVDKEDFERNAKGEYAITVDIADAGSGQSYGSTTVLTGPGQGRNRALTFGQGMMVPEGVTVTYVLGAKAKNGKTWKASATTQVWTTNPSYAGGFQPVMLFVSDDLAQDKGGKG
jgi:hypothetical protein